MDPLGLFVTMLTKMQNHKRRRTDLRTESGELALALMMPKIAAPRAASTGKMKGRDGAPKDALKLEIRCRARAAAGNDSPVSYPEMLATSYSHMAVEDVRYELSRLFSNLRGFCSMERSSDRKSKQPRVKLLA